MKKTLSIIIAASLLALSCSKKTQPAQTHTMKPDATFENTSWKLVKLAALQEIPVLNKEVTIIFRTEDRSFSGYAGCNNMRGSYTLEGNNLKLGNAAVTRMMCAPDNIKVEDNFLKLSGSSVSIEIHGDHMLWKQGDKVLAEFDASRPQ